MRGWRVCPSLSPPSPVPHAILEWVLLDLLLDFCPQEHPVKALLPPIVFPKRETEDVPRTLTPVGVTDWQLPCHRLKQFFTSWSPCEGWSSTDSALRLLEWRTCPFCDLSLILRLLCVRTCVYGSISLINHLHTSLPLRNWPSPLPSPKHLTQAPLPPPGSSMMCLTQSID